MIINHWDDVDDDVVVAVIVLLLGRVGNQTGSGGNYFCYGQEGSCYRGGIRSVRHPGRH